MAGKIIGVLISLLFGKGAAQLCDLTNSLTTDSTSFIPIDVNLTQTSCFRCPEAASSFTVNNQIITSGAGIVITSTTLMISDWTVYDVSMTATNRLSCIQQSDGRTITTLFFTLTPGPLTLLQPVPPFFFENSSMNIDIFCINNNRRPGYNVQTQVWTDSDGTVVGNGRTLLLLQVRASAGTYTCGISSIPIIPVVMYDVVIYYAPEVNIFSLPSPYFEVNDTLSLTCGYVGVPEANVTWTLNSIAISDSSIISITTTSTGSRMTTTLTWNNVPVSAQGTYNCVLQNIVGSAFGSYHIIVVADPSPLTLLQMPPFFFENSSSNINILCINNNAVPGYAAQIWTDSTGAMVGDGPTLTLPQVRESAGTYTCRIFIIPIIPAVTYEVVIYFAPEVTTDSNLPTQIDIGETLILECRFLGVPDVTVTWTLNSIELNLAVNSNVSITIMSTGSSKITTLTWSNVPASAQGTYNCVLENVAGSVSGSYSIEVGAIPVVSSIKSTADIVEGSPFEVECEFESKYYPDFDKIKWLKNGQQLKDNEDNIRITTNKNIDNTVQSIVSVTSSTICDNGIYTCIIENQIISVNKTIQVQVKERTTNISTSTSVYGFATAFFVTIAILIFQNIIFIIFIIKRRRKCVNQLPDYSSKQMDHPQGADTDSLYEAIEDRDEEKSGTVHDTNGAQKYQMEMKTCVAYGQRNN